VTAHQLGSQPSQKGGDSGRPAHRSPRSGSPESGFTGAEGEGLQFELRSREKEVGLDASYDMADSPSRPPSRTDSGMCQCNPPSKRRLTAAS
jgi:hypothetical protein